MSISDDIAVLKRQEEVLQFKRFNEEDAWALGTQMQARAAERKLPLVMDIRIGIRPVLCGYAGHHARKSRLGHAQGQHGLSL
jgi:uncharacterized protein (UPF0303 family)